LVDLGTQRNEDHIIFIKHYQDKTTILIVYVDGIMMIINDHEKVYMLKKYLAKEFEIKDLERLHYFLGIEVDEVNAFLFLQ